jgi:hypothetical protein
VALSLGIGEAIWTDSLVINTCVEPQKYVWTSGDGQPESGVFAGLHFQL